MIQNEQLKAYFEPYCKEEVIYKRYQEILKFPDTFDTQLQMLKQDILKQGDCLDKYWWPEVNRTQDPEAVRALWYPFHMILL